MNTKVHKIDMSEEERILWKGVKKQLRVEEKQPQVYRITYSPGGITKNYDVLENRIIIIDQVEIEVMTNKIYKKGYMNHFYYVCENSYFDSNNLPVEFCIYVPFDYVDDNVEFFTTTIIERRLLKLKQLKEKINI